MVAPALRVPLGLLFSLGWEREDLGSIAEKTAGKLM